MINRDFSKSGKDYIKKNKVVLITLGVIILLGIVMLCAFGFNGGAEVKGYNTFSINIGEVYDSDKMGDYIEDINSHLASNDAKLYSVQLTGEGDYTTLVVKYSGNIKDVKTLNGNLAQDLDIHSSNISEHTKVSPSLGSRDYIYAVACGLIIITIAVIFTAIRYNMACAISMLGAGLLGVILLMSLTAIFRLTINGSFLAINIITLLLILGEGFIMFDGLEKERAKLSDKYDRNAQLTNTMRANAYRQKLMYGAIFAMSLIFVILMPNTIKQASIIMLFATIITLFITIYALPCLWNLTITQVSDKIRVKKDKKVKAVQVTEDTEGELENKYTENQVIEVKEDAGDETPSSDDNITIE